MLTRRWKLMTASGKQVYTDGRRHYSLDPAFGRAADATVAASSKASRQSCLLRATEQIGEPCQWADAGEVECFSV